MIKHISYQTKPRSFPVIAALSLLLGQAFGQSFSDCDVESYYSSTDISSKSELASLVKSTHRRSLPYTNSNSDDVWKALMDLDVAETDSTKVHLIYADIDVPASLFGEPDGGWNREHVWPKSRGVETNGDDFTDIHHLKPSDWNVNSARGNKYFSACRDSSECVVPATGDAAGDTAADDDVWLPPVSARGIAARAILYMELRYDGTRSNELDLTLTDCPDDDADDRSEMAYLSQILEWHEAYPPTSAEVLRNDKACERWQGNRNPFVDHPELVKQFYGEPTGDCSAGPVPTSAPGGGAPTTSAPNAPISAPGGGTPTTSAPNSPGADTPTSGSCEGMFPGAVMIIGVNSDNPDVVSMVSLTRLVAGTKLYITDNAWTGASFRSNEGTMMMTVQDDGIAAGEVFSFDQDSSSSWQDVGGSFALSASGDTVLLYCETEDFEIVHISALSFSGDWMRSDLSESAYGSDGSALPGVLSDVAVTLSHADNYRYEGTTSGTPSELQQAIAAPSNWEGSNDESFAAQSESFTVVDRDGGVNGPSFAYSRADCTSRILFLALLLALSLR